VGHLSGDEREGLARLHPPHRVFRLLVGGSDGGRRRALGRSDEDVPGSHLVLGVLGDRGIGGLHFLVGDLARLDLEPQHLAHQLLAADGLARRLPGNPLLLERLLELGDLHAALPGQLLETALHLVLGNVGADGMRLALDELLVDQLLEALVEQRRLVAGPGRLVRDLLNAGQLRTDAFLHFRERDGLSVDDGRDALLDLRARGGGAQERDRDEDPLHGAEI